MGTSKWWAGLTLVEKIAVLSLVLKIIIWITG